METTTEATNDVTTWDGAAAASAGARAEAAQDAMPPRRFDELLPCTLTDEELRERGAELVRVLTAIDAIDAIEAERSAAVKQFKARIDVQEARARELRDAISTQAEEREVACLETYEVRLGEARTVRLDTGEQVRVRSLRPSELQPTLPAVDTRQMTLADASLDETDDDDTAVTEPDKVLGEEEAAPKKRSRRGEA